MHTDSTRYTICESCSLSELLSTSKHTDKHPSEHLVVHDEFVENASTITCLSIKTLDWSPTPLHERRRHLPLPSICFYCSMFHWVWRGHDWYVTLEQIWLIHHKLCGFTYCSGFVNPITPKSSPTMVPSSQSQRSNDWKGEVYVQSHLLLSAVNCHGMDP